MLFIYGDGDSISSGVARGRARKARAPKPKHTIYTQKEKLGKISAFNSGAPQTKFRATPLIRVSRTHRKRSRIYSMKEISAERKRGQNFERNFKINRARKWISSNSEERKWFKIHLNENSRIVRACSAEKGKQSRMGVKLYLSMYIKYQ